MATRQRYQRIADLLWLVASVLICVAGARLDIGSPSGPGPGFMMLGTGLLLVGLSVIAVARGASPEEKTRPWAGRHWKKVIAIMAALLGYVLVLGRLGYITSTFLLMLFVFGATAQERRASLLVKAAASAGLTYLVFDRWLDCQLPKGIFGL